MREMDRLPVLQRALDFFVQSDEKNNRVFNLTPAHKCFLDLLFAQASDQIGKIEWRTDTPFAKQDIFTISRVLLPRVFANFSGDGHKIDDKSEMVQNYIKSLNQKPNFVGTSFVSHSELKKLKDELVRTEREFNDIDFRLERVPDGDGGVREMQLSSELVAVEKKRNELLKRIPKNADSSLEVALYDCDMQVLDDYILTPSLFKNAGVKENSKNLVFNVGFLMNFVLELNGRNIQFSNIEKEAQKILLDFLHVEAEPHNYFAKSVSDITSEV